MTKKRCRCVHLNAIVFPEKQELIYERMAEAGIRNMGTYMSEMALNGYVLPVELAEVRELVPLQRRCTNNLNQVTIHDNTCSISPPGDRRAVKGLCRSVGVTARFKLKAVRDGGTLIVGKWLCSAPQFFVFGIFVPKQVACMKCTGQTI